MKCSACLAIVVLALGASAHAADDSDLSARSHAVAAAKSLEAAPGPAPFIGHADSLMSTFRGSNGAVERVPCADGFAAVCYDARDRGLIYRGARDYMPHVQGFTPEGVALRHDRLILRYTFR
jgi:hypothetical protein